MDINSDDILAVLHGICEAYPHHAAVAEGDKSVLTYQQLWRQALQVAEYINRHSGCNCFVGIHLPKSTAYIVSMIGCWMAGKAFVPIGTDLPPSRRKFISGHADITLTIQPISSTVLEQRASPKAFWWGIPDSATWPGANARPFV